MIRNAPALNRVFRLPLFAVALMSLTACMGSTDLSQGKSGASTVSVSSMQAPHRPKAFTPERLEYAVATAKQMRARGQRVWCVPFARNASGIDIRGDAREWWGKAKGIYGRSHDPQVGAVMAFSATRKNPRGHVAVVSEIISDREIRIDHANWKRNQVSLGMKVVDISAKGDWSKVRVESTPGTLGRPYPVSGFIHQAASTRG